MKKQQVVIKMKSIIAGRSTEMLKDMAKKLMNDFQDGAGVVFCFVLEELENRMDEAEYVEFCEAL